MLRLAAILMLLAPTTKAPPSPSKVGPTKVVKKLHFPRARQVPRTKAPFSIAKRVDTSNVDLSDLDHRPSLSFDFDDTARASLPFRANRVAEFAARRSYFGPPGLTFGVGGVLILTPGTAWVDHNDIELRCHGDFRGSNMKITVLTENGSGFLEHGRLTVPGTGELRVHLLTSELVTAEPMLIIAVDRATSGASFRITSCSLDPVTP